MFQENNFFSTLNLKSTFRKHQSKLICAFMVGVIIGSIPFIYKYKESMRVQKLIQKQRKMEIQKKEKICKNNNSDYKKFLNLGFPKTAIEKFDICMKEQ